MDAVITNLGSSRVFIPGPNIDLAPTGDPDGNDVRSWADITVADLDANEVIKAGVVAGTLSVSVTPTSADAATALKGTLSISALPKYAFADLPTGYEGRMAFVTNGRKTGEGVGAGTGVPAYYSAAAWRVFFDDTAVAI